MEMACPSLPATIFGAEGSNLPLGTLLQAVRELLFVPGRLGKGVGARTDPLLQRLIFRTMEVGHPRN